MVTCYLSPIAEHDIDEIVSYIAQKNPKAAQTFLDAVFDAIEMLANHPDIGHLREDLTDKNVKFWLFKWHYLIVYKLSPSIEIIRVLSGYRDLFSLMNNDKSDAQLKPLRVNDSFDSSIPNAVLQQLNLNNNVIYY